MPADEKHGLPDSCEEKKSPFMNGYVHEKIKMLWPLIKRCSW